MAGYQLALFGFTLVAKAMFAVLLAAVAVGLVCHWYVRR